MASRRSVQLLQLRSFTASTVARPAPRIAIPVCRALCTATQTQCASRGKFEGVNGAGRARVAGVQQRWHSSVPEGQRSKVYEFEDVLSIVETPSDSHLLVDVREPHEFEANTIPTAINIPVTSQPDALLLDEEDFKDRFGFDKPPKGKEIVFFCKAGVRSSASAGIAKTAGYTNVGEYRGSWLDWERRGGPGTKTPPPTS